MEKWVCSSPTCEQDEWYYPQIAQYTSITRLTSLAAQVLLIPILKYFEVSESLVMVIIMILGVAKQFVQGFANDSWMFYLGKYLKVLDILTDTISTN